jgi:hypothetical protein
MSSIGWPSNAFTTASISAPELSKTTADVPGRKSVLTVASMTLSMTGCRSRLIIAATLPACSCTCSCVTGSVAYSGHRITAMSINLI